MHKLEVTMCPIVTYLIEVYHHIALQVSAALDIFQSQGEVDPSGIRDVEIIRIVLVPFLDCSKHLILISADDVHVLGEKAQREASLSGISLVSAPRARQGKPRGGRQRFIMKSNQKPKSIYLHVHMHILHILSSSDICTVIMN